MNETFLTFEVTVVDNLICYFGVDCFHFLEIVYFIKVKKDDILKKH